MINASMGRRTSKPALSQILLGGQPELEAMQVHLLRIEVTRAERERDVLLKDY